MRGLISGILLCLAATALHAQTTIIHTPASLHPLPLVYTGKTPAIFLPDSKPTQPYIATHIVEVSADISVETNELISKLQERGKAEGVDAILLYGLGQKIIGPAGGVATLNGVGIKYKDSINYLDNIIRQRVVTTYDAAGKPGPSVILNYNWRGSFTDAMDDEGQNFMVDSILPFDVHLLLLQKPEMYEYQMGFNNKLSRIRLSKNVANEKAIQWIPDELKLDKYAVRVTDSYNSIEARYTIELMQEKGAAVNGASISYKQDPFIYLYFEYDTKGRIVAEKWYKLIGGKKRLWLSFDNRFHSNDPAQWPAK
ncbi:MAG: hypothetical protein IT252_04065 [Chitinophagaceae bacterium]|nr:hypothetical protein [Chitinophagaceae bacterium]